MNLNCEYLVILERGERNWGAYAPDIPGCISTGKDRKETRRNFMEALQGHLDWMQRDGDVIPPPQAETEFVTITLPGLAPRRYLIILQPTLLGNWSATPADVPDLVLEFTTRAETLHLLRVALQSQLETMLAAGEPLPEPASEAVTVTVRQADVSAEADISAEALVAA